MWVGSHVLPEPFFDFSRIGGIAQGNARARQTAPHEVRVGIDKTGQHHAAAQIDHPRLRSDISIDASAGAYGQDAVAADRDRLRDGAVWARGIDRPATQHEAGAVEIERARWTSADRAQTSGSQACEHGSSFMYIAYQIEQRKP